MEVSKVNVSIFFLWLKGERRKHVFRDLKPYVCTFKKCVNAEKLYATRHDWLYHESQVHRQRWACDSSCSLSFPTKDLLEQHMREQHPDTTIEAELSILLDMSERPAVPEEIDECPLCPENLTLLGLRSHVAAHLEDLALFILPDNGVGAEDANSDSAERSGSRQSSRHSNLSNLSNLSTSEDVKKPDQSSADFMRLFTTDSSVFQVDSSLKNWVDETTSQNYWLDELSKEYHNSLAPICTEFISRYALRNVDVAAYETYKELTHGLRTNFIEKCDNITSFSELQVSDQDSDLDRVISQEREINKQKFLDMVRTKLETMELIVTEKQFEELETIYRETLALKCMQLIFHDHRLSIQWDPEDIVQSIRTIICKLQGMKLDGDMFILLEDA